MPLVVFAVEQNSVLDLVKIELLVHFCRGIYMLAVSLVVKTLNS